MWTDYYFYLMTLPELERNAQITIFIVFWAIMLCVGILAEYIKNVFKNKMKSDT